MPTGSPGRAGAAPYGGMGQHPAGRVCTHQEKARFAVLGVRDS